MCLLLLHRLKQLNPTRKKALKFHLNLSMNLPQKQQKWILANFPEKPPHRNKKSKSQNLPHGIWEVWILPLKKNQERKRRNKSHSQKWKREDLVLGLGKNRYLEKRKEILLHLRN